MTGGNPILRTPQISRISGSLRNSPWNPHLDSHIFHGHHGVSRCIPGSSAPRSREVWSDSSPRASPSNLPDPVPGQVGAAPFEESSMGTAHPNHASLYSWMRTIEKTDLKPSRRQRKGRWYPPDIARLYPMMFVYNPPTPKNCSVSSKSCFGTWPTVSTRNGRARACHGMKVSSMEGLRWLRGCMPSMMSTMSISGFP